MANQTGSEIGAGDSWIGRGSPALLRGMGALGVGAVGLAGIGLTSTGTLLFSQVIGAWPGVNLAAALGVGLVVCLALAYTYSVIAAAVPRAGSDYILASRVLSAPLAFVSSWVFVLFGGLLAGTLLGTFVKEILPFFNQIAVMIFGSTGSQDLIQVANQPVVIITAGTVVTVVAFVGLFLPQRILQRLLMIGVGLGLAAWLAILINFSSVPTNTFEIAWNQTHGIENAFTTIIPAAQAAGFQSQPSLGFPYVGLAIGLWMFFGFISAANLGGEVRKSENAILWGSGLALLIGAGVLIAAALAVTRAIPADWMAAESYLSQSSASPAEATPYITYYAGLLIQSLPLLLLIFWGWVLAFIAMVQAFILFLGRIMLAWADDGLLPEEMAYVHPHYRSPLVTQMVAAVLVQLGLVAYFAVSLSSLQARIGFFGAAALLVPITAVTFFPFLKKNWFDACPAFVRRKIGPLPVVTLTGLISLAYLLFLLSSSLFVPSGSTRVTLTDLLLLGGMVISGMVWYAVRRMLLRGNGVQLEEVTSSLPHS